MLNKWRNELKDDLSRENNTFAKTIRKIFMCQPPQAPRAARNDILNQGARRAIPVAKPSAQFFIAEFSNYYAVSRLIAGDWFCTIWSNACTSRNLSAMT
ncbi:MAG: hypothetical protein P8H37_02375 [Paracoccaceae bacterium]|nr:hypothetical protein [Paracoccaceae bacterium]